MQDFTPEAGRRLDEIAGRHGLSLDAAATLLRAVAAGGGTMAQFSHPELGGMGQWSPGMTMVGDMFNTGLRARVEAVCGELSALLREVPVFSAQGQAQGSGFGFMPSVSWWPPELGTAASSGAQNDMRYAYFPSSNRLAVQSGGQTALYDTQGLTIYGVSQQQGYGQSLQFSSDRGTIRAEDLRRVDGPAPQQQPEPQPFMPAPAPAAFSPSPAEGDDPLALIERLAGLHAKGILSAEEFAAKKAELLGRL